MGSPPSLPLVRRLPRAILVAIVVALCGVTIGVATADDPSSSASLSIPLPMGGDKAQYDMEDGSDAGWDRKARIEVLPVAPLILEDGTWASAYGLRMGPEVGYSQVGDLVTVVVGWQGIHVDAATGEVVAHWGATGGSAASSSSSSSPLPFGLGGGESESAATATTHREYGAAGFPCGTRSSLQGSDGQVGDTIRVSGCSEDESASEFRVDGVEELDGAPALFVSSEELAVRLAFQPGVPYPVLYVFDAGTEDEERWRLEGFQRGLQPLVPGPLPPPVALPPVEDGTADRFGPAVAPGTHPFPVEEAVQYAQERSKPLADFMAAHPDWFVRSAEYTEEVRDGVNRGTWGLAVRGDDAQIFVVVPTPDEGETDLAGPLLTIVETAQPGASGVHVNDRDYFPEPAWPTDCRPSQLPSVDSLSRRWAAMEGRAVTEANSYAFDLHCFIGDEVLPAYTVASGDSRVVYPEDPSSGPLPTDGATNATQIVTMLSADQSGTLAVETAETSISRQSWGTLGAAPSAPEGETLEANGVGVWGGLAGPVAAGITLASLLAGAAYFLWPAIKGGALGLFSRVQPDQVLEHPQRQRLVLAVESEPGIHYQALLRKTGLAKGTLEHHLHVLTGAGHLRRVRDAGYTCYFVGKPVVGAAATKAEGARRLLQELQAHPGLGLVEAAAAAGLSPATASHHLARLEEAGLVRSMRDGRIRRLWPTGAAGAAVVAEPDGNAAA